MSRKKIKFAYITNDSARKTTYKKRTKACAIYALDFDSQLEVWLSHASVRRLLCQVQEAAFFLEQSLAKATQHLRKLCKENRQELKTMFQSLKGKWILHSLNLIDLKELGLLVKQNLKEIDNRVRVLTKARCSSGCY
ncbi:hypothetical protein ES319_A13G161200v1 [Gossypium barbadense]|uniref:MADS-box domain-containing protein n=2 Tax=Gossypium TaxID=3633 RepID=A0A5J5T029_GOSBA|nr:hypothetical protein ES319_A13G161200v1 [Gossypium barbadense]TXG74935.1 hypothetical protein ES288_1Z042000v1 [Gossypium darwinii]TYG86935.1 hypothetical protein ES288_A13G172300v1 [Gossypium darwinii]